MKRALYLLIMVLGCLTTQAQTDVPAAGDAVPHDSVAKPLILFGYLSYDSMLVAMPQYAIVRQQMADLRQAYETELKRVEDEFNQKYEAFLEGRAEFPRTILLKRQTELQEMLQRNVDFKRQGQEDLQRAEREALAPLRILLNETIASVARELGLALVVNTDSNACPFIEPMMGVDINEAVLNRLLN